MIVRCWYNSDQKIDKMKLNYINIFKKISYRFFSLSCHWSVALSTTTSFSYPCHHKGVQVTSTECREQAVSLCTPHGDLKHYKEYFADNPTTLILAMWINTTTILTYFRKGYPLRSALTICHAELLTHYIMVWDRLSFKNYA